MEKPDIKAAENFEGKSAADVLNAIKNDEMTSRVYADAVPDAIAGNIDTLHSIGRIIKSNPELQNAFVKSLINRIALTLIKSKSYLNPYRAFKRGFLEFGEIVEDIFVDLVKPHAYNPVRAEKEMLKLSIEEFSRIQRYMLLAEKESAVYKELKERYIELKVILTSSGINITELDRVKE